MSESTTSTSGTPSTRTSSSRTSSSPDGATSAPPEGSAAAEQEHVESAEQITSPKSLAEMAKVITTHRPQISPHAPRLLTVHIDNAEFWNVHDSKMVQIFKMMKAAVTGETPKDMGRHKTLNLNVG
jgi:hypothetical protein